MGTLKAEAFDVGQGSQSPQLLGSCIMNSTPTATLAANKRFDVRSIPCSIKHKLILQQWAALEAEDFFVLVNDHDPVPLKYQFEAEFPGAFSWEHLQKGPEVFEVKITKLKK